MGWRHSPLDLALHFSFFYPISHPRTLIWGEPRMARYGMAFYLKIPRGDRNGVGEDEVTVTSGLHAQVERTKKQTERRATNSSSRFFSPERERERWVLLKLPRCDGVGEVT